MDRALDFSHDLMTTWRIARLRLLGQMSYRSSFIMQIFGNFLINAVEVVATLFLFNHFDSLGGWNLQEVMFLHGISMVAFSIGDTIANGIQGIPTLIKAGEFDRLMIRPMPIYLQAIVNEVSLRHVGQMIQGIILFAYGAIAADVSWSFGNGMYLALMIACAATLFVALFTIEAILSFWTVNSVEAINAFTYGGSDISQYPLHIFPKLFRNLFLWILPLGFTCYYPAMHLMDKEDSIGLPRAVQYFGVPMTLIFCLAVAVGWHFALRRHSSTGS